ASASICARTPYRAERSRIPVRTVSGPFTCETIDGNAPSAIGPSWPEIRIEYTSGTWRTCQFLAFARAEHTAMFWRAFKKAALAARCARNQTELARAKKSGRA